MYKGAIAHARTTTPEYICGLRRFKRPLALNVDWVIYSMIVVMSSSNRKISLLHKIPILLIWNNTSCVFVPLYMSVACRNQNLLENHLQKGKEEEEGKCVVTISFRCICKLQIVIENKKRTERNEQQPKQRPMEKEMFFCVLYDEAADA